MSKHVGKLIVGALVLIGAGTGTTLALQSATHENQQLTQLMQTQRQLKQGIAKVKQAPTVTPQTVNVNNTIKAMQTAGEAVLKAAPVIAQQRLQNPINFRSNADYQHAYGIMNKYVDDSPAWNPVSTPWITMFPLQGSFVYGPLNSANLREVAWIFKHNNQPVVIVTAAYAPNSGQFINAQLYQANNQALQAQWDNHNNANSSSKANSSSQSSKASSQNNQASHSSSQVIKASSSVNAQSNNNHAG